jgi:hypothetical protein
VDKAAARNLPSHGWTRRCRRPRHLAPLPAERAPPFVLLRQPDGDVLIAPFPRAVMLRQIAGLDSFDKPIFPRTDTGIGTEVCMSASLRTERVEFLVTIAEKAGVQEAAERAGLVLSTWSRMLLLRQARAT